MSENGATNKVDQYINKDLLKQFSINNTAEEPVGSSSFEEPPANDKKIALVSTVKPAPKTEEFSFKIEEQIQALKDLNQKFLDAKVAVEIGESVYGIRPSSKESSSYLIYKKELERTTAAYFDYLKGLAKENTFNYGSDQSSQNKKKHERSYVDFYRIANDSNLVFIEDPKDVDPCDVAEQIKTYVKDIDKIDVMMRYVVGCIYAVSVTLTKGNYAASPAKQLENLLHSINQN